MKNKDGVKVIRGHSFKAAANMSDVKVAHIPKFSLSEVPDHELRKLERLADRLRLRMNINKYVHNKK